MDPLDPARNGEGSAYSKRRLSSILKAPRKSSIVPDSEQQENVVDFVNTVEKRISRRVSFAATNNVLLFSDDAKSGSSAKSPLQDLVTTAGMQKRTQVAFADDLSQQAGAKETLKHTSLHASLPWNKENFDTRDNLGEKTVMFGSDDAFMDMTQSHSVHIATDAQLFVDISMHSNETTSKEKTRSLAADDGSMDMTLSHTGKMSGVVGFPPGVEFIAENKNTPVTSVASLDPDFENFLASLFKPGSSSTNPENKRVTTSAGTSSEDSNTSLLQSRASKCHVDKENQPPAFLMEKSFNAPRKRGLSPGTGAVDVTKTGAEFMDMTQSHTVHITGDLPDPQTQSQRNGKMRPNSAQEEKQKEAFPISSTLCSDFNFKHAVTGVSTTSVLGSHPDPTTMKTFSANSINKADGQIFNAAPSGGAGREDDVTMDMTEAQTGFIMGWNDDQVFTLSQNQKKEEHEIAEKRPSSSSAGMNVSYKPSLNMKTDGQQFQFDAEDGCRDNTARFSGEDACMDETESCTGSIATDFGAHKVFPQSCEVKKAVQTLGHRRSLALRSLCCKGTETVSSSALKAKVEGQVRFHTEDRTVRFSADDACMDVTQCQTVNISAAPDPELPPNSNLSYTRDKTVTFPTNAADIDVTQCLTGNISAGFDPKVAQTLDFRSTRGDRTVTFSADMDVTQCLTGNIKTGFHPKAAQTLDLMSTHGDRTVTFSADMDVTQCCTGNIASDWATSSVSQTKDATFSSSLKEQSFPFSTKGIESEKDRPVGSRPSMGHALNPGFKSLSKRSTAGATPVIVKADPAALASDDGADMQVQDYVSVKKELPISVPANEQNPEKETVANHHKEDVSEGQSNSTLTPKHLDEPPLCALSTQATPSSSDDMTEKEAATLQKIGSPDFDCKEFPNPASSVDIQEKGELSDPPCWPESLDRVDAATYGEPKRMSLVYLQSKVRRLSHMVNAAPGHTAPLPQLENDFDPSSKDESQLANEPELDPASGERDGDAQADCSMEEGRSSTASATPFKLKSDNLVSRLSVGGFKPMLPHRGRASDPGKATTPVGGQARTVVPGVSSKLPGFDCDVSDLNDEELESCEDDSETFEMNSPCRKSAEAARVSQELPMTGMLEDNVFLEGNTSDVNKKKRPLILDGVDGEQKIRRLSTSMAADIDMDPHSHHGELDWHMTQAACSMAQSVDEHNSSNTASGRCEATFESTLKQSLFESQFEDYADDMQKKFDDGTITVKEFLKIFNIDFVIHNPRQSILPDRLADSECTPMDLLKDRHICRPKQLVYEKDILSLTEKVDGLKGRMQDLDRPLQIVNNSLWEEIFSFSEEELKSFGAKLKERSNLFRKRSKAQSHEMKEVLYSNIVQANQEVQQSLSEKIEEADKMIKTLDSCIDELKTELTAIEEKGPEGSPGLKWCQEEMERVSVALADGERKTFELEIQNEKNIKEVDKLKTETKNWQSRIATLHLLTEWKLGESSSNSAAFTFLYETFHLQVVFENGSAADEPCERKVVGISLKHEIDEEKTKDYGCLVHKLLSQYTQGECAWVEKYPTSRHVPMLLQDVSLRVSSCRLLGEELRLLSAWGGMRFNILSISCVDTRAHFVFSSLKNLSKFEVTFSTSLTEEYYALRVHAFKNKYGSATIQQVEEIVASFSPCKDLLTKVVKKINESLLC